MSTAKNCILLTNIVFIDARARVDDIDEDGRLSYGVMDFMNIITQNNHFNICIIIYL